MTRSMDGPKVCKSNHKQEQKCHLDSKGQAVKHKMLRRHTDQPTNSIWQTLKGHLELFVYLLSPHPFPGTSFLSPASSEISQQIQQIVGITVVGCTHNWVMVCNCTVYGNYLAPVQEIVPATTLSMIAIPDLPVPYIFGTKLPLANISGI